MKDQIVKSIDRLQQFRTSIKKFQTLQQVPEGCSNPEILEKKTELMS